MTKSRETGRRDVEWEKRRKGAILRQAQDELRTLSDVADFVRRSRRTMEWGINIPFLTELEEIHPFETISRLATVCYLNVGRPKDFLSCAQHRPVYRMSRAHGFLELRSSDMFVE